MDAIEELGWIEQVAPVQYSIRLLVPPGSCLLGKPYVDGLLGPLDELSFTYTWAHPDPRMDVLQAQVAGLAQGAERAGEARQLTFQRIRNLALSVALARPVADAAAPAGQGTGMPRLTEDWFC
jgi:hypothetical protein